MPAPAVMAAVALAGAVSFGLVLAFVTEKGRAPMAVQGVSVIDEKGRELGVGVPTCNGNPEGEVLSENSRRVVIRVVSDVQTGVTGACLDSVQVRLGRPLGDRELIDATTTKALFVPPKQRG